MAFEKLARIFEINVAYTAQSALAIKAGRPAAFDLTDAPVLRVGGRPVIPGSSLKGALRSTVEAILAQKGVTVCVPYAAIPKEQRGREKEYVQNLSRKMPCTLTSVCPVCDIFGTASERAGSLAGRLLCLDATPAGEWVTFERGHVALTRDTKSAAGGKFTALEAVDAGAVFVGALRLINPEDWQVGALLRALEALALLGLGAKKSAGYGEVAVAVRGLQTKRLTADGWQAEIVEAAPFTQAFAQKFGF